MSYGDGWKVRIATPILGKMLAGTRPTEQLLERLLGGVPVRHGAEVALLGRLGAAQGLPQAHIRCIKALSSALVRVPFGMSE